MGLERLVHRIEGGLCSLGRVLLNADARTDAREELELLVGERARHRDELARIQSEREAAQERLAANQPTAALLPSLIESSYRRGKRSQAMRQALELESLRKTIADDLAALPRLEQTAWSLRFHLRQLDRRMDTLEEQARLRRGARG